MNTSTKGLIMNDFKIDFEKHLNRLGDEIQHVVDRFTPESMGEGFRPRADIVESDKNIHIFIDLPGLSKKEVFISVKDEVLIVKGERVIGIAENEQFKSHERKNGMFSRSFALPAGTNSNDIKANFSNGVLDISFPKGVAGSDSTTIPIN